MYIVISAMQLGLHSARAMHLCTATTALNIVNQLLFISIMEMGRPLWPKKNWMFIHNLYEQATGSQPLTAVARVRSQPVQLQLDAVATGHAILPVRRSSPVGILPLLFHTQRHLQTTLIRRTSGRRLETFKQSNCLRDVGVHWTAMSLHITLQIGTVPREI